MHCIPNFIQVEVNRKLDPELSWQKQQKKRGGGVEEEKKKKKTTLFTNKLDLNLGKKLVNCYIWSLAV
jgi:hypothetical protein